MTFSGPRTFAGGVDHELLTLFALPLLPLLPPPLLCRHLRVDVPPRIFMLADSSFRSFELLFWYILWYTVTCCTCCVHMLYTFAVHISFGLSRARVLHFLRRSFLPTPLLPRVALPFALPPLYHERLTVGGGVVQTVAVLPLRYLHVWCGAVAILPQHTACTTYRLPTPVRFYRSHRLFFLLL